VSESPSVPVSSSQEIIAIAQSAIAVTNFSFIVCILYLF